MNFRIFIGIWTFFAFATPLADHAETEARSTEQGKLVDASTAFEHLLSLAGEWVDVDGTLVSKGEVAVIYEVTGNGSALIETIFPEKPYEMVTVFHKDGDRIALTHYCSLGNQPEMHSVNLAPNKMTFSLSGGSNFDPARDRYMHSRRLHILSENEMEGEWQEYIEGAATSELHKTYRLQRKL